MEFIRHNKLIGIIQNVQDIQYACIRSFYFYHTTKKSRSNSSSIKSFTKKYNGYENIVIYRDINCISILSDYFFHKTFLPIFHLEKWYNNNIFIDLVLKIVRIHTETKLILMLIKL